MNTQVKTNSGFLASLRFLCGSVLLFASLLFANLFTAPHANAWQAWQTVGEARLKYGPWVIYDSELRSPSGQYSAKDLPVALVIKYQRSINRDDLLEATDDQWKHLGISSAKRQQWIDELAVIWPDVVKGDRLIFVLDEKGGSFYRDNKKIGQLSSKEMSVSFLHIWLSPNTAYPEIRNQLIGNG